MLLIAAGSLLAYGCNKSKNIAAFFGGGEDEHRPIIIVKIVDVDGNPIPQCATGVANSTDTLMGTTDANGIFNADIPTLGAWNLGARKDGYSPFQTTVQATDSVTYVTDTLKM